MISKALRTKLERMIVLHHTIDWDNCADEEGEEFSELQEQLVEEFLPVVSILCAAGMLSMFVNLDHSRDKITDFSSVMGEELTVWEDGNIQITGRWDGSGGLRPGAAERLQAEREERMAQAKVKQAEYLETARIAAQPDKPVIPVVMVAGKGGVN
jgi:hypothetical protein